MAVQLACLLLLLFSSVEVAHAARPLREGVRREEAEGGLLLPHAFANRKLLALVPETPLVLGYHGGPVMTGGEAVKVYIVWYGSFSKPQKHIIVDFLRSFSGPDKSRRGTTVREWWRLVSSYKRVRGEESKSVEVVVAGQTRYRGGGLFLKKTDLAVVAEEALRTFPAADDNSIVLVLTAKDVMVEDFCQSSCGYHSYVKAANGVRVAYGWVGNAADQCPGMCAWPFAKPSFPGAPEFTPLLPPNADLGADGMVINIASVLAGAATNPLGNGFYQGDARLPLEAATACAGKFGPGAYPGSPGDLLLDPVTGSSHNAHGIKKRTFLLPTLWNPATHTCELAP